MASKWIKYFSTCSDNVPRYLLVCASYLKMVYKIFSDGGYGTIGKKPTVNTRKPHMNTIEQESMVANFLIKTIKLILFVYDIISLPIYFIIQRPDRRAYEAQRTRSERVDINTWIKTDPNPNETSYLIGTGRCPNSKRSLSSSAPDQQQEHKYMGATLNEIFANAIHEFNTRSCLGYRAVVTCPVIGLNEEGKHIVQEKSFRSDYTWYTYEQIGRRVQDIASGLYYNSVFPGSKALFLASTSLEWFCASQACFQLATKLVVAPEINDVTSLRLILEEAEIETLFASCDRLNQVCMLMDHVKRIETSGKVLHLKRIVLIDWQFPVDFTEPIFDQLQHSSKGVVSQILSMGQVEEAGVENPIELCCTKPLYQESIESLNEQQVHYKQRKSFQHEYHYGNNKGRVGESRFGVDSYNFESSSKLTRRRSTETSGAFQTSRLISNEMKSMQSLCHLPKDKDHYTITRKSQLDLRSSSRLSVDSKDTQVKLTCHTDALSPKPNDLAMIIYTHGSLGQIKAVMLTHSYLARSNHYLFLDGMVNSSDIHCTTLSMDNLIEFMTEMCVFSHGGSIGYSCNSRTLFYDGKELFKRDRSDLEALNPTFLLVRPSNLEILRNSIQNYLSLQLNPLKSFILNNVLYDYKKYWARKHFKTSIVDRLFCSELKRLFGSNLKYILCNGATDCSETKDFFAFMVGIPIIELYGPDEAIVSLISVKDIWDWKRRTARVANKHIDSNCQDDECDEELIEDFPKLQLMPPKVNKNIFKADNSRNLLITSSILCPTLGTRIRLEDWEDFRTSDLPYPRGRIVIGGDVVCKGYFKRQKLTDDSFYVDSNYITWFRTNDIARVFPNGSFEIISGMTDMIKMEDGQFISLSQIEHILRNSQFVDNVCAICDDDRKLVIALVVPNLRCLALKSPGEANLKMAIGTEPEPEELTDIEFRREVCNDRLLCEFVDGHLKELITKAGFQSIPSSFHLVPEIWTPESELITPSFEPKRGKIQKFYAADIQSIFRMKFKRSSPKRLSAILNKSLRI